MKRVLLYAFKAVVLSFLCFGVHAAETVSESPQGVSTGMILETLFALIFVAVAIFGVTWLIRRLGRRIHAGGTGYKIKMQSVFPLGSRERLVVVEVDGQRLLLGVTSSNISFIKELKEPSLEDNEKKKPTRSEGRLFQQLLKKK